MNRLPISTKDLCEELCRRASTESITIFGKSLSEILDMVCKEPAEEPAEEEWVDYEWQMCKGAPINHVRLRRLRAAGEEE